MTTEHEQVLEWALRMESIRESIRGFVAGLVNDGFTEREAHAIVANVLAGSHEEDGDG